MTNDAGPSAPDDEWDYLPRDDELAGDDDDESAEEAALHVIDDDVPRAADPGRSDVVVGDEDAAANHTHFPDEDTGAAPAGGEHEPDLEEILESQHYAFPDEGDADDD